MIGIDLKRRSMWIIMRINIHIGTDMEHALETRPRKATNVTLPVDVYEEAKALGINFSRACEQALRDAIKAKQGRRWATEHAGFINEFNARIEKDGLPLEEYRMF
jgi:antitoxin CcdA